MPENGSGQVMVGRRGYGLNHIIIAKKKSIQSFRMSLMKDKKHQVKLILKSAIGTIHTILISLPETHKIIPSHCFEWPMPCSFPS